MNCVHKESTISDTFKIYSIVRTEYRETAFLESLGEYDEDTGRYALIGVLADQILVSTRWETLLTDLKTGLVTNVNWLDTVDQWCGVIGKGNSPDELGAIGYIGYENHMYFESIKTKQKKPCKVPDVYLVKYRLMFVFDHISHKGLWIWNPKFDNECRKAVEHLELLYKNEGVLDAGEFTVFGDVEKDFTKEQYIDAVKRCIQYIKKGDILQANITMRFLGKYKGSPFKLYCDLREYTPNPYFAYMDFKKPVISTSPEGFIKISGGRVFSRPIKGTVRYTINNTDQGETLKNSEKNRSENIMITDLIRNDIGRICKIGSVDVPVLCGLRHFNQLYHLETIVTGEVEEGINLSNVLRWNFPGGSVTGAPKIRAMEIIDELEYTERGPYCGAIGFFGNNGYINTCVGIRIIYFTDNEYMLHAGGGIVVGSDYENEYDEMLLKAENIISIIQSHNVLNATREQIDEINKRMIRDLSERMECIKNIGVLKSTYGIPEMQTDRVEQMLQQAIKQNEVEKLGLTEEVLRNFLEFLVDTAMKLEKTIKSD